MKITYSLLPLLALTGVLAGCSANPITPEGARVRIIDNERLAATVEESCQWIAEVSGSQGNVFTADITSEKNMLEGARNSMRNKAANYGGNTIIIQRHQAVESERFIGTGGHTFVGQVFFCKRTKT